MHKVTGEVMVLKELFKFDREAQNNFLKEVQLNKTILIQQLVLTGRHSATGTCRCTTVDAFANTNCK